jgi:hypothetical protein
LELKEMIDKAGLESDTKLLCTANCEKTKVKDIKNPGTRGGKCILEPVLENHTKARHIYYNF